MRNMVMQNIVRTFEQYSLYIITICYSNALFFLTCLYKNHNESLFNPQTRIHQEAILLSIAVFPITFHKLIISFILSAKKSLFSLNLTHGKFLLNSGLLTCHARDRVIS